MEQLVFVYGTLKRGFGNSRLLGGSAFLGVGHTSPSFAMYRVCPYFPGVCQDEQNLGPVYGEVYRVNDQTMRALDRLEGCCASGGGMYHRVVTDITVGKAHCDCWIYLWGHGPDHDLLIPSGKWKESE